MQICDPLFDRAEYFAEAVHLSCKAAVIFGDVALEFSDNGL